MLHSRDCPAVAIYNGVLFVLGGNRGQDFNGQTTEFLNLSQPGNGWQEGPRMNHARVGATVLVHGNALYVLGGTVNPLPGEVWHLGNITRPNTGPDMRPWEILPSTVTPPRQIGVAVGDSVVFFERNGPGEVRSAATVFRPGRRPTRAPEILVQRPL